MKVDANPQILGSDYAVKEKKGSEISASEFSAIFEESLGNVSSSCSVSSKDCQMGVNGISKSQLDIYGNVETSVAGQVENYLNVLNEYQEKLMDPDVTLKELSPLVEQMTREGEKLSSILESLPKDDNLKEILNETLVLSSLESIKFNRGDYNPL